MAKRAVGQPTEGDPFTAGQQKRGTDLPALTVVGLLESADHLIPVALDVPW